MDVRRLLITAFAIVFFTGCQNSKDAPAITENKVLSKPDCGGTQIKNQYIVRWKDGRFTKLTANSTNEILSGIMAASADSIDFIEPDVYFYAHDLSTSETTPVPGNWGFLRVQAKEAQALGATGAGIKVAVIDSGVDVTHPQLVSQLARNLGESGIDANGNQKNANGIDDDGNGLVDDYVGYDFEANSPKVKARAPHGTHVAGIVLASQSEDNLAEGVAPKAQLLPINFMDEQGMGSLSDAISAIQYARQQNAKIINASWGGPFCSKALQKAIADTEKSGILFVAAAGNSRQDLGNEPDYPASFFLDNQISVGSSNERDVTSGFSNYSYALVHLMAPGDGILSTYPKKATHIDSGTSMASPFVAGAAAAAWSLRPNATWVDIKAAILDSVDAGPYATITRGRLNVLRAVKLVAERVQP